MMCVLNVFYFFLICLTIIYCLLLIFYRMKWVAEKEFSTFKKDLSTKVSIIISARNEEENISNCLQSILFQDYPKELFEVILLDDSSEDKTRQFANTFKTENKFSNLRILSLIEINSPSPKKRAITEGIKNALGELIITTDADCTMGKKWLSTLVSFYESRKPKMIVSPVCISGEQTVFEKIQSLEISGLMLMTGASVFSNKPLMCNGANLAFSKNIFEEVKGYDGADNFASGDDVMLMEKIKAKYPGGILFLKSREAIVFTFAQKTLIAFFNQRKRWISKISAMRAKHITQVGVLVCLLNISLVISVFVFLISNKFILPFIACFSAKCTIDFLFLLLSASFIGKKYLLLFFLPAEIFQLFYVIVPLLFLNRKYRWKNRELQ